MNYWTQSKDNIYVAAHRGWSEKYPENTRIAMQAALDLGVDQIETDVRITRDGELVLFHDETVDRTTSGTGRVRDFCLAELKQLDAGSKKDARFAGAQVITLLEFMEMVKDHPTITLDLELKEYPTPGNEEISYSVCDRVLQIMEDYHFSDRCVINTFSGRLHQYIYEKYGRKYKQHLFFPVQCMNYNVRSSINLYEIGYCCCMFSATGNPEDMGMAIQAEFDLMREKGVQPWVGASVKDAQSVDLAIANGAELITCNNPDVILSLLRQRGKHP